MPFATKTFSFPALGTTWHVEIVSNFTDEETTALKTAVVSLVADFENKYSRFKADSLITKLNKERVLPNPETETVTLLQLGQDLYQKTATIFNPLVGEHLNRRGYDADYSFIPQAEPDDFPNPLTDLQITPAKITLTKGLIDLGGYGKGYALDLVADFLRKTWQLHDFLINAGGDIIVSNKLSPPWELYLEHPTEANTYLGKIALTNASLASSSPHKREWRVAGKTYNHIIDTSERAAVTPDVKTLDASFVVAPSALAADVLGTVLLITHKDKYQSLLESFAAQAATYSLTEKSLSLYHNFPKIISL